ncbi:MAG: hypothetical protein ACKV19_07830 [Verrucomicrobiales bacterium]
MHAEFFMAVVQQDHAAPNAPPRFLPEQFVPWGRTQLGAGHAVHVGYGMALGPRRRRRLRP